MPFQTYAPRPIQFLGIEAVNDYQLKFYSIVYGDEPFQRAGFETGLALAKEMLPNPAINLERPGVGFVILHQGRTGKYLILCWWDCENELPTKVFIEDEKGWRLAVGGESFCVWDLEVIWLERETYVGTVLAGKTVEEYLNL